MVEPNSLNEAQRLNSFRQSKRGAKPKDPRGQRQESKRKAMLDKVRQQDVNQAAMLKHMQDNAVVEEVKTQRKRTESCHLKRMIKDMLMACLRTF